MGKIIDASIPKILTERVLLALLFLFLTAEDYSLITHRGNLSWFDQATPNINAKDAFYFVIVLALSWLYVLPVIKVGFTMLLIPLTKRNSNNAPGYLSDRQLLARAIDQNNSAAYQHLENYKKKVKTQKVVRELYFYVLVVAIVNVCCDNSFTRHLFMQHPIIGFLVSQMVLWLGVAVGIINDIEDNEGLTDVMIEKKDNSHTN